MKHPNVQALPGSVRRWRGSSFKSGQKVVGITGRTQPILMRNKNTGGNPRQVGPAGNSLVILNKSDKGEPLVVQILGEDGRLGEKKFL